MFVSLKKKKKEKEKEKVMPKNRGAELNAKKTLSAKCIGTHEMRETPIQVVLH